jgi:hypothetical protein
MTMLRWGNGRLYERMGHEEGRQMGDGMLESVCVSVVV